MSGTYLCDPNWQNIVANSEHLLNKRFRNENTLKEYIFKGILHASDDYYYLMLPLGGGSPLLLTCVGDLTTHEFTLCE